LLKKVVIAGIETLQCDEYQPKEIEDVKEWD